MKLSLKLPSMQLNTHNGWTIEHSPQLSVKWLRELLDAELPLSDENDAKVLKVSPSTVVVIKESDLGLLTAKLNRSSNLKEFLSKTLYQKTAKSNWQYAHYLRSMDIDTPEPLAFICKNTFGLKDQSWFIYRYDEGVPCDEYFFQTKALTPAMNNTASAIVDLFMMMKAAQVSHGNMEAANLLISNNRPSLIALDHMQFHSNSVTANKYWQKDIDAFMNNWWQRFDIDMQFRLAFSKQGIEIS